MQYPAGAPVVRCASCSTVTVVNGGGRGGTLKKNLAHVEPAKPVKAVFVKHPGDEKLVLAVAPQIETPVKGHNL